MIARDFGPIPLDEFKAALGSNVSYNVYEVNPQSDIDEIIRLLRN
jgi:hypothetical protein